ncbi:hypothetical protein NBRC116494_13980 [Aurantivibrio plasticivorans]
MKSITTFGLAFITLLIVGCNTESSRDTVIIIEEDSPPPRLDAFHLVDSYGVSSEESPNSDLVLNPYLYNGEFEVFWDVTSERDYAVEIRLNDQPTYENSRLISTDYCGTALECESTGLQFCNYYSDFSMSCDPPNTINPGQYVTFFEDWVYQLPQQLYMLVDVCDTESNYCEYSVREILVE